MAHITPTSDEVTLASKLSSLNVNAPAFIPSFEVKANISNEATIGVPANLPIELPNNDMDVDSNDKKVPAAESWEDTTENSVSSSVPTVPSTPEDDEYSMESDPVIGVPAPKPKSARIKVSSNRDRMDQLQSEKEHVNVVFIGHVDAGKSTIGGQIMFLTGMVDKRTLEKYEKEAKEKNRESWYLSWCMDTNSEEREKGKTVEVGRAFFETETKHFTILDAPGHKSFVPNMIGGASQADLAVLVISARKGEFETGFERGGQTREHAMLVKTAGVKTLIVLVNKMDDPTVQWNEERYNYCKENLHPYLKKMGFKDKDIKFMPCSGLCGTGLLHSVGLQAPWYTGEAFIPYIDNLPSLFRNYDGPFMMPIVDKYADMGTVVFGKVESGSCVKGQSLAIYPNRMEVKVDQLWSDDIEVTRVSCGENIKVKVKGVDEADITPGFVLCDPSNPIKSGRIFDAQVAILEHRNIICAGKSLVLHLQAMIEEVKIRALICLVDRKTGEKSKTRPRFIKQDQLAIVRFECEDVICMEKFVDHPQLGRFTLRDEGKTIAIGKILKVVE